MPLWAVMASDGQSGFRTVDGGILLDSAVSARVIDLARAKTRVIEAGAMTLPMDAREITIARVESEPSPAWRGHGSARSTVHERHDRVNGGEARPQTTLMPTNTIYEHRG